MANEGFTGAAADAVELLTAQHREVEQLWSQFEAAHARGDALQNELMQRIVTAVSQHDAIETQYLYPAVREVPGGDQLADHSLEEHQKVRRELADVDGNDPRDATVFGRFSACIEDVLHHVAEEEGEVFPKLRATLGEERLMYLGNQLQSAMSKAPTHPHPMTPNNPVGAKVAGAAAGLMDKARDAMTQRDGR